MGTDNLSLILSKIDMNKADIEYILSKLYKYSNDPILATVIDIVNANMPAIENFSEVITACAKNITWARVKPLMMFTPNDPLSIRVYPNITVDHSSNIKNLSTTNYSAFNALLTEYENDLKDKIKINKWQPLDRAQKRLNEYIDLATARALTRFANLNVKDNEIRDLATRIDEARKPIELLWAETPEQFLDMYTGGQNSCMSAEGHDSWKFLIDQKVCPASLYAFMPHVKGAHIKHKGKNVARAVCFQNEKGQWSYGRIYATTGEYNKKFQQQLKEAGLIDGAGAVHNPPKNTTFRVKGYKKLGNVYAAPVPYCDNMEHSNWYAAYDDKAKEFTFSYIPGNRDKNLIAVSLGTRNGCIISTNYMTMECSNCATVIAGGVDKNGNTLLPTKDSDEVFCSDKCAHQAGFMKVITGTGEAIYQRDPDNELVDIVGTDTVKFSNLKAAQNQGRYLFMEELGVLNEEGDTKVVNPDSSFNGHTIDSAGKEWFFATPDGMRHEVKIGRVPVRIVNVKTVLYNKASPLVVVDKNSGVLKVNNFSPF